MKRIFLFFSFMVLFLSQSLSFADSNWAGNYSVESESAMTNYMLTVTEQKGNYQAILDVTGRQVYYQLQMVAVLENNKMVFRYQKVLDGVFYQQQDLEAKSQSDLFALEIKDGQLITQWRQLIVDDEVQNKSSAFIKQ